MTAMRLLVLGANGRTGRLVVTRALEAGHEVTAFVRDPGKLRIADERLRIANGDARESDDLRAALAGREAVINTIGGGERQLIEQSTLALVDAMDRAGVRRVVATSTFLATPNYRPTGTMKLFPKLLAGMTADDRAGVELLAASSLDWTIVYATLLKNKADCGYRIVGADDVVTGKNRINRAAVAECLLTVLGDPGTIRKSLLITGA